MKALTALVVLTASYLIDRTSACREVCLPVSSTGKEYTCNDVIKNKQGLFQVSQPGTCEYPKFPSGKNALCCSSSQSYAAYVLKADQDAVAKIAIGAYPGEFPHQVFLEMNRPGVGVAKCGGTIYNKNYIITAMHCVTNQTTGVFDEAEEITVTAGETNIANPPPESKYKVAEVIHHKKYNHSKISDGYDIALLKLATPLKYENPRIRPLKIAPKDFQIDNDSKAIFMGWGNRNYSGEIRTTPDLHKSFVPLRKPLKCQELSALDLKYYNPIEGQLCIAGGDSGVTVGQGDSGGPTVCADVNDGNRPILCGVASYKSDCMQCGTPAVYIRVSAFNEWIQKNSKHEPQESEYFQDVNVDGARGEPEDFLVRVMGKKKICDGVLIARNAILTAQSCIKDNDGEFIVVHTKSKKQLKQDGQVPFDGFKQTGSELSDKLLKDEIRQHDLILIRISNPVEISFYPEIPPVGYEGQAGMELSFASSRDQRDLRNYMLMNKQTCQKSYEILNVTITDDQLCGVQVYAGGSSCDRPLGSPLICEGKYLCGIASSRGCFYNFPNIFASTSDENNGGFIRSALEAIGSRRR